MCFAHPPEFPCPFVPFFISLLSPRRRLGSALGYATFKYAAADPAQVSRPTPPGHHRPPTPAEMKCSLWAAAAWSAVATAQYVLPDPSGSLGGINNTELACQVLSFTFPSKVFFPGQANYTVQDHGETAARRSSLRPH